MRKFLLALSIGFPLLFSSTLYAAQSVKVMADEAYPPYSYKKDGKMTGIYTDVLSAIFAKMPDFNIKIEGVPWKRGLKSMEAGEGFALYPPYKREDRPYMDYTAPILAEESAAYCDEKILSKSRPKWPEDYYGLRIGSNSGFAVGGAVFDRAVQDGLIKLSEAKGNDKNLLKLINGRIDCYINDALSIEWELNQLKQKGKYKGSGIVRGATISGEYGYLGFTKKGDAFSYLEKFKEEYHKNLEEMKSNGEVDKIIKKYTE
ncbi:substrate-binding periplasmic protein [Spartinivicinus poritis]|uniref:Transporter substrate-binding domain-containing protein n=1 Tax=Spartinivicinus poritis TaxID=2994640 RepID=A0ABT5UD45_9GAMM|nr:transporter substrate-binding domain-containing protein [Spartinivicinus sp. A2-2]MDE1464303.1 transporter substrate-binding domain-containing protein [Spartinivicinus sp. A2-2]